VSVHTDILKTVQLNFTDFSAHVDCGHDSVLLWWYCDMLCTSSFVDYVTFLHN